MIVKYHLDGSVAKTEEDGVLCSDPFLQINHGCALVVNSRADDLYSWLVGISINTALSVLLLVLLLGLLLLFYQVVAEMFEESNLLLEGLGIRGKSVHLIGMLIYVAHPSALNVLEGLSLWTQYRLGGVVEVNAGTIGRERIGKDKQRG